MANSEARKKQIMEHLSRSIKLPQQIAQKISEPKKQQIMDHIKQTRG